MSVDRPRDWRFRLALVLYRVAMDVLFPLVLLVALPLLLLKEKRRKTLLPRLGFQRYPDFPEDAPAPLWMHALSVGELLSAVPLIRALKTQLGRRPLVLSVSTLSARTLAEERLGEVVDHILYFPFDTALARTRCLGRVRPAMVVLVETDVWPGFQQALCARGVPSLLINGRLSPATYRASQRLAWLHRPALNSFKRICPQSVSEAERYRSVGVDAERLGYAGNLKFDLPLRDLSEAGRRELFQRCGLHADRPVWIAGSTHAGEEEVVCAAFRTVRVRHPRLQLIVAPRHPHRSDEVVKCFSDHGLRVARYSAMAPEGAGDVVVIDVLGVLAQLYSLAGIAFIGGSLVRKGGQNPIEAADAGCAVMFGPDMSDFPDVAQGLLDADAARIVHDPSEMARLTEAWLSSEVERQAAGVRGCAWVAGQRGALDAVSQEVIGFLGSGWRPR